MRDGAASVPRPTVEADGERSSEEAPAPPMDQPAWLEAPVCAVPTDVDQACADLVGPVRRAVRAGDRQRGHRPVVGGGRRAVAPAGPGPGGRSGRRVDRAAHARRSTWDPHGGGHLVAERRVLDTLADGFGTGRRRRGGPRRQGTDALAAARGRGHHRPGHRHGGGRLPARPVRRPLPPVRPGPPLPRRGRRRRHRGQGSGRLPAGGPSRTDAGGRRLPPGSTTPAWAWCAWPPCWPGSASRCGTPWPTSARSSSSTTWSVPWCGCWPAWRWSAIPVDRDVLRTIATELTAECAALEATMHELAGSPFNVNSVKQLRTVLYDDLGLQPGRKTKTGFSTDARTLESLRGQHPIIEVLLRYREVEKLRSTYGETPGRRGGTRRPDPRHLPPDGGPHRPAVLGPAQPPQHPGPHRRGPAVPRGVRAVGRSTPAGGRLRPGRAAGHRPPVGRPGPDRGVRGRGGHPPHGGRPGVRGRPGRGHPRAALDGQDGLLRPGLRHGVLRPGPAPGRAGRGGQGHPRRLLRRLPLGPRLHGPGGGRGPDQRLHGDHLRPPAAPARPARRPTTRSARPPSARP